MTRHQQQYPPSVRIVEVGPRDGLQNIRPSIPTATKIELIRRLHATGLTSIEVTSAVSPKAVPQLADNEQVLASDVVQSLLRNSKSDSRSESLRLPVLVPNTRGLETATRHGANEVAVFVSASEGFSKANTNCSIDEGLERARKVAEKARAEGVAVRAYVSCIFSCPYDGPTPPSAVHRCVQALLEMGCYEVSLGDTVGMGVAADVKKLLSHLFAHGIPASRLAGHFHDTFGQAVSNVWTAYELGLRVFDSSVAGLGGCPYAPGAKGNVATEDLVYLFEQAGVYTGIDAIKLIETGIWISKQLSRENGSRAGMALAVKHKLAVPIPDGPKELPVSRVPSTTAAHARQAHEAGSSDARPLTATMISRLTSVFSWVWTMSSRGMQLQTPAAQTYVL